MEVYKNHGVACFFKDRAASHMHAANVWSE